MRKIVINENQRGLVFENGKFVKLLTAGKYILFKKHQVDVLNESLRIATSYCSLDTLLENESIKNAVDVYEIGENQVGLRYVNGKFTELFKAGKYAFFKTKTSTDMKIYDITDAQIKDFNPLIVGLPATSYTKYDIQHQVLVVPHCQLQKVYKNFQRILIYTLIVAS